MPGARAARMIMIVVTLVLIAGLVVGMIATPARPPRAEHSQPAPHPQAPAPDGPPSGPETGGLDGTVPPGPEDAPSVDPEPEPRPMSRRRRRAATVDADPPKPTAVAEPRRRAGPDDAARRAEDAAAGPKPEHEAPATEPTRAGPPRPQPTIRSPRPPPSPSRRARRLAEPRWNPTPIRCPRRPAAEPEAVAPAPAEPTTVAELVAATLRAAGVRLAFTVAGESFLGILDALTAAGIRVVATRHEGAAAFAAEAYGQLTGRPAVCLGTRAVGAANLAIGIHTATADSTAMFVLVGQVDRGLRGREAFQEVDLVHTIGGLAKWAGELTDAESAADILETAVRATVEGRPGPVCWRSPRTSRPWRSPRAPACRWSGRTPRRPRPATCAPSCTSWPAPSGR